MREHDVRDDRACARADDAVRRELRAALECEIEQIDPELCEDGRHVLLHGWNARGGLWLFGVDLAAEISADDFEAERDALAAWYWNRRADLNWSFASP